MRIEKSDLNGGTINNIKSSLENELVDTTNLIEAINSLITETADDLQSPSYELVRTKLANYITILTERKNIILSLQDTIPASTKRMETFMEEYTYLDDSKLPNVNSRIIELENYISSETTKYNNGAYNDSTGKATCTLDSLIASYKTELEEKKKLKDKLTQLPSIDYATFSPINEIKTEISKYYSSTNSVQESNIKV